MVAVKWIYLAQDKDKRRALVKKVINICVKNVWVSLLARKTFAYQGLRSMDLFSISLFGTKATVLNYMSLMGWKRQVYVLRTTSRISLKE
jgi:hypothetical protein